MPHDNVGYRNDNERNADPYGQIEHPAGQRIECFLHGDPEQSRDEMDDAMHRGVLLISRSSTTRVLPPVRSRFHDTHRMHDNLHSPAMMRSQWCRTRSWSTTSFQITRCLRIFPDPTAVSGTLLRSPYAGDLDTGSRWPVEEFKGAARSGNGPFGLMRRVGMPSDQGEHRDEADDIGDDDRPAASEPKSHRLRLGIHV